MYRTLPERRKSIRIESSIPVHYKGEQQFITTVSRDIGENGVKFTTNRFIPVFSKLVMDIFLFHNAEPVRILTEVIWVRKLPRLDLYSIGTKFLGLSKEHKRLISHYLEANIAGA